MQELEDLARTVPADGDLQSSAVVEDSEGDMIEDTVHVEPVPVAWGKVEPEVPAEAPAEPEAQTLPVCNRTMLYNFGSQSSC